MTSLRISINEELEQILNMLEIEFPTLSRVDIVKLCIGEYSKIRLKSVSQKNRVAFTENLNASSLSDEQTMGIALKAINELRENN